MTPSIADVYHEWAFDYHGHSWLCTDYDTAISHKTVLWLQYKRQDYGYSGGRLTFSTSIYQLFFAHMRPYTCLYTINGKVSYCIRLASY